MHKVIAVDSFVPSVSRRKRFPVGRFFHLLLAILVVVFLLDGTAHADIRFNETTSASNFDNTESWGASWAYIDDDLYPDLFVGNHRSPVSIFRNNGNGTFTNIIDYADPGNTFTGSAYARFTDTHGTAFADIDRDGDQDFVTLTSRARPGILMLNDGTGRFTNATDRYGLALDFEGRTPHWMDYDNDGALDLLMTSGTVSLFRNMGIDQPWQEKSVSTLLRHYCQRDQWFMLTDMDDQPGMEFVCGHEGNWPGATLDYNANGNAGNGVFVVDPHLPKSSLSHGIDSVAADFDGDLDPDLFVTRGAIMPSQAKLVARNRIESWMWTGSVRDPATPAVEGLRTITFTAPSRLIVEVHSNQTGQAHLIQLGGRGRSPANDGGDINKTRFILDINNPAHQGLYYEREISPNDRDAWFRTEAAKRTFIGHDGNGNWTLTLSPGNESVRALYTIVAETGAITNLPNSFSGVIGSKRQDEPLYPGLLINEGNQFSANKYSDRVWPKPAEPKMCASVVAADFDNDMDLDIYMVCRRGVENIKNVLLENDGQGRFTEVTGHGAEGGIGAGIGSGWAQGENVVTADYDLDGNLDLFVTNGMIMQPLRAGGQDQLFHNTTNNGNSWAQLLLKGTVSNIEGIGAQVKITANGTTQLREQNDGMHRWSQNLKRIHVGLGRATQFDLEITWPSGTIDRHIGVAANEFYNIIEGDTNPPRPLDRPDSNPIRALSSRVSQSVDDAVQRESDNSMILGADALNVTGGNTPHQVGLVFRDINVPPGAQIISAHIEFTAAASDSGTSSQLFAAHATNYTGIFKPRVNDIGFRGRTNAKVAWNNIVPWTAGQSYWSANIGRVIQEVVNRPGWISGNPVAVLITENESQSGGTRTATSFDGNPATAPRMVVKWQ